MVRDFTSNQCALSSSTTTSGGTPITSEIEKYVDACSDSETFDPSSAGISQTIAACPKLYIHNRDIDSSISNKDISDRFLTALILSLIVCLANIGLALFGFLLFRTPGDF